MLGKVIGGLTAAAVVPALVGNVAVNASKPKGAEGWDAGTTKWALGGAALASAAIGIGLAARVPNTAPGAQLTFLIPAAIAAASFGATALLAQPE